MFHTIILTGYIGRDPELRYTPNGDPVCNFNVATDRKWKNADGELKSETTWFRVSIWGKQAEPCNQHLHKGSFVIVEGHLVPDPSTGSPRVYTRQDGTPGASFEIRASTVKFGPRTTSGDDRSAVEVLAEPVGDPFADSIDIPF